MNELRNIDVDIISIVDKGANQKSIIWKGAEEVLPEDSYYKRLIPINKIDDDKKIVYGIVYSPNQVDAHGDYATADEIEKACYAFMKKSKTGNVDTQHDMDVAKNCYIGENWIVKDNDALFPAEVGAWAVALKIENEEIWKSIKEGVYTGISMYGHAEKITKSSDDQIEKGIMNFFKKIFSSGEANGEEVLKDFNDRITMMDFPKLLDALYNAAYDILYDEKIEDKTAAILDSIDQFKIYLSNIETAKSIAKAGRMISDTNMKKLTAAVESLQAILEAADKSTEKRKNFKIKKSSEGDSEMTPEEIQKKIDDSIKPIKDENEQLKKDNGELKEKIEKLEGKSSGSTQSHEPAPIIETKKAIFPWGNPSQKKS